MEKQAFIKVAKLVSLIGMMVVAIVLAACDSENSQVFLGTKMAACFILGMVCILGHRWQEDIWQ